MRIALDTTSLRRLIGEKSLGVVPRSTTQVLRKVLKAILPFRKTPVFGEHALAHSLLDGLRGAELGPSAGNPFGLQTLNVSHPEQTDFYQNNDRQEFRVEPPRIDVWATGDILPFKDRSQDFILSSHVVEHLPNVIRAFVDWNRSVRNNGYVFMIVPLKGALPADGNRELSSLDHFVQDYLDGVTTNTHPTEGVPGGRYGHYHTFSPDSLAEVVNWMIDKKLCRWELIAREDVDSKVGNGFTLAYRVKHV